MRFGKGRIDWFYEKSVIRLMNALIPQYFKFTWNNRKHQLQIHEEQDPPNFIVSLTTFPARINKVWLVIETILRQTVKPDAVILWLYRGEFPDKAKLPKRLLAQEKRGLQIRFCDENLMPHKKYFYTIQQYPQARIITVDDDFYYPSSLIKNLIEYHITHPNSVCCSVSRQIYLENEVVQPYSNWKYVQNNSGPSLSLLTMGGGGTLIPPGSLHEDVFDIKLIKDIALFTDDLWIKIMSLKKNTKVFCLAGEFKRKPIPIRDRLGYKLMNQNIGDGNNDRVFKELLKLYNIRLHELID